jgi:hypothetical protein
MVPLGTQHKVLHRRSKTFLTGTLFYTIVLYFTKHHLSLLSLKSLQNIHRETPFAAKKSRSWAQQLLPSRESLGREQSSLSGGDGTAVIDFYDNGAFIFVGWE